MKLFVSLVCLSISLISCKQEEYGSCPSPRNELKIMFKPRSSSLINSHSFCIVCDPTLQTTEYETWALDMGAPQGPSNPDEVHPCLYAYTNNNTDIDTFEQCTQLICNEEAVYNDMVGINNGNFNLSPILE